MVVMMMVMIKEISTEKSSVFSIDQSLNIPKLLNVTRDRDCPFLSKTKLFFSFLQELSKQRMIKVHNGNHKSLLLFSLSYLHCQTPFWYLFMIMLMMMETWDVEAPVAHDFVSVTHGPIILKVKENSQCSWRVVRDGW
ncbi:transmembrane protein [Arabidopsis thaliana]|uniref:Transmembrane protein n=1 Tax=Arabidopsis thaliana TaxID=3702 RepID=A0A1P8B666_ARATH|nr:uncharacterized protein AT4G00883 [Arabidopsis thaliana]ANM67081.1 transmembrane protein [Arabidopsis thaliana]|eukprot:NP_001328933.1 transmembrane protein [Arabidopsis thaliana]